MALPNYAGYPGNLAYEQPFIMKQLQLYGFIVEGKTANMQAMVDARLNFMSDRPGTKYIVASDKIMFAFTQSPFLQSLVPQFQSMGRFTEITCCSYIFVAECTLKNGEWWAQRILTFIPYIVVNTPLTLIGGREDYGYPKTMGEFIIPTDAENVDYMLASTIGIQHFGEDAVAGLHEFIGIRKDASERKDGEGNAETPRKDAKTQSGILNDIEEVFSSLRKFLTPSEEGFHIGLKFLANEAEILWKKQMSMVFLRQFRDIGDPSKACYQAIIEADGYPSNMKNARILHDHYTLTINHMDTLPIDTDLGLSSSNKVSHAFAVMFDASFDKGKEVYRSV